MKWETLKGLRQPLLSAAEVSPWKDGPSPFPQALWGGGQHRKTGPASGFLQSQGIPEAGLLRVGWGGVGWVPFSPFEKKGLKSNRGL